MYIYYRLPHSPLDPQPTPSPSPPQAPPRPHPNPIAAPTHFCPRIALLLTTYVFARPVQKDARRKTMKFGGTNTSRSLTATRLVSKTMNGQKPPNAFTLDHTLVKRPDTLPEAFRKLSGSGPSEALCISVACFDCQDLRLNY